PKQPNKAAKPKKGTKPAEHPEVQLPAPTESHGQPDTAQVSEPPPEVVIPPAPEAAAAEPAAAGTRTGAYRVGRCGAGARSDRQNQEGAQGTQGQEGQRPGRGRQGARRKRRGHDHPSDDRSHGLQGLLVLARRTDSRGYV